MQAFALCDRCRTRVEVVQRSTGEFSPPGREDDEQDEWDYVYFVRGEGTHEEWQAMEEARLSHWRGLASDADARAAAEEKHRAAEEEAKHRVDRDRDRREQNRSRLQALKRKQRTLLKRRDVVLQRE